MKAFFSLLIMFSGLTAQTPKQITWTAIGDSITYLNDHADETGNRITKGYMTRVVEKMPGIKYINQGHNGWKAVDIANQIDSLGLLKADIYSIFLGTNDWWGGVPVGTLADYLNNTGTGTFYGSLKIIIDKVHRLNATAKIVLITPMQRGDFVYIADNHNNAWGSYKAKNGQQLSQFAAAVKSIGEQEQIKVVDLYNNNKLGIKKLVKFKRLKDPQTGNLKDYAYPAYTAIPFNADKDANPYPVAAMARTYDGLHPSDKGFEVIADLVVKAFK